MKIFDSHVHMMQEENDREQFLAKLEKAGVWGSVVFSLSPQACPDFQKRLDHVLTFTAPCPGRLFPFLWIHPHEDGILEKVDEAASRGIMGFKIICNDFYVYEDRSIALLHRIAKTGKPVTFHSGILWYGNITSDYNRPLNWECCIEIPELRFALAHCSWPWHDECIALYGKFLNATMQNPALSCEMFLDITPGTPEIYREDLQKKLHTIGYDVSNNILFGTDCMAANYNSQWTKKWMTIDNDLYRKLGVSQKVQENIYHNNLMRYLGLSREPVTYRVPDIDGNIITIQR